MISLLFPCSPFISLTFLTLLPKLKGVFVALPKGFCMRRASITFLLLLLGSHLVFGGLNLADYEVWQRYNGWPMDVIAFPGIHSFRRAQLLERMATERPPWTRRI